MSLFEAVFLAVVIPLALAALWFWVRMIVHCVRHTEPGSSERWIWLLIVVLGKLPGAFAYWLLTRQDRRIPLAGP